MQIALNQLTAQLGKGLRTLYTVYGDEALLVQETVDAIRAAARAAGHSERNSFTESTRTVPVASCTKRSSQKWTPSIHMPRWASRITLEITDVRVERLNSITEADAAAEGVGSDLWFAANGVPEDEWTSLGEHGAERVSHINTFATLWESIYGAESWQANPWVWVIEFKRVDGGAA